MKSSGMLFSQPSESTSTAPAFGCRQMSRSTLRVFSWSSESWEQPKLWCHACMASIPSSWVSFVSSSTSFSAIPLTQPTVGTIHISLRTPTSPFLRTYPLKVLFSFLMLSISFTGLYSYSSVPARLVFRLFSFTHSPAFRSWRAWPMG